MGIGIQICGLNGCGKSTFGKALAEEVGFYFIDSEELFFNSVNGNVIYTNPNSRFEAERILLSKVRNHENFVFAAAQGNFGDAITPFYSIVVLMEAPIEIRMQRVRLRSFQKMGIRMLPGGDLHDQEEAFFQKVFSRQEADMVRWLKSLSCPIIRIDGTRPVEENLTYVIDRIEKLYHCGKNGLQENIQQLRAERQDLSM